MTRGALPGQPWQSCSNLDFDRSMTAALSRIDSPAARSAEAVVRAFVPNSSLARRSSDACLAWLGKQGL